MRNIHNQYVSTPNWFTSIKTEEPTTVIKQQVVSGFFSGNSSGDGGGGISSLSIHNKAIIKSDVLTLSDLSVTGYAVAAVKVEDESIIAGQLINDSSWSSSLFVAVVGGSEITINTSYDSTLTYGIAFYDIQKKYISGNNTVQELIQTISVPETAVYFRICSLSTYEPFNVTYQGLSPYSYKLLNELYYGELDPFTTTKEDEYINSYTFTSSGISFVADYPLRLEVDSNNNIHFNINELLMSGTFVTTSEEEQDIEGIKYFKNGLGIGDFLIIPDRTNNSLKLIHKNELTEDEANTYFGNMYVTGWFSALGASPGGTGPSLGGGKNNLFELNDVAAVYNNEGIPYAVLGATGTDSIGKVLTWDGSKWYAGESLDTKKGDERYLLKKVFSKIFTAYDANGNIIDITDYNSIIDNISINYGLWSTGFISAYGMSKGGSQATALYQLVDVLSSGNKVYGATTGSVLMYDGTHWYASKLNIETGVDENDVLGILHRYEYLTKGDAEDLFLTQDQADDRYLLKRAFKNIFTAYDSNDDEVDICDPNADIDNVKVNFGFWSESFISALGKQIGESSSSTALYQLIDVLSDGSKVKGAVNGSVLTYDGNHWYATILDIDQGLDENEVLSILTKNGYLTKPDALDLFYTKEQIDENYLLKKVFSKIFTAYKDGAAVDITDYNTVIDSIKVNYGFWSEDFISVLGESNDSNNQASALYQLVDVLENAEGNGVKYAKKGSVLTFDGTHWIAGVVDASGAVVDETTIMEVVERYNYVDTKYLTDNKYITQQYLIDNLYLTQSTADDRYLLKTIFSKIFTAYDSSGNAVDFASTSINNIGVNYNFWSKGYVSAQGISDAVVDAMDFIQVDGTTISKENGYLEVIGGTGSGGIESLTIYIGSTPYKGTGTSNVIVSLPKYPEEVDLSDYATIDMIPDIPTKLPNPTSLTWSGYTSGSYDGSTSKNISIPSRTSQLTNDSDYATESWVSSNYLSKNGGSITGNLTLKGTNSYGNKINFGDGDYVYIYEENDDKLTIYAADGIHLNTSGSVTINGSEILSEDDIPTKLPNPYSLTINNSSGTAQVTYDGSATKSLTLTKAMVGLGSVENTALSTWKGTSNITTVGTITSGTWHGSDISYDYLTIPTRNIVINGTKWAVHSSYTTDSTGIYAPESGGTSGYVLKANGSTSTPTWVSQSTLSVDSASTLSTARTLWGQSFNGSKDISGSLSGVSDITANYWSITQVNKSRVQIILPGHLVQTDSDGSLYLGPDSSKGIKVTSSGSVTTQNGIYSNNYYVSDTSYAMNTFTNGLQLKTYSLFRIVQNGTVRMYMNSSGNFGIKTSSPQTALHVAGSVMADNNVYVGKEITIEGGEENPFLKIVHGGSNWYVQCRNNSYMYVGVGTTKSIRIDSSGNLLSPAGITMYSDERKKTILNHVELSLEQIANAPLVEHYYNSDEKKTTHVGSIAQYWAGINDWFCKLDGNGFYTMEIQNLALASSISVARELQRFESETDKRIRLLEEENKQLKLEIEQLKNI